MQEICDAADLSPGTVYRYFRSKDDLIAALIDDYREQTSRSFAAAREETDVMSALVRMANEVLRDIEQPSFGPLHFECTANRFGTRRSRPGPASRRASGGRMAELLRRGQASGQVDPSLDPATTARTLIALIDGLAWRKFVRPGHRLRPILDTIRTLLDRFLKPARGGLS